MKIVLLTNILSPYRKVFYDKLYTCFQEKGVNFTVLVMAETEPHRHWHFQEYKGEYCELLDSRTITYKNIHFHFNKNLKKRIKELEPDILIASGSYLSPSIFRVIEWKKKFGYQLFFWSESHLDETRNYGGIKLLLREWIRGFCYKRFDGYWYAGKKSFEFIKTYSNVKVGKKNNLYQKPYYFIPNLVEHDLYNGCNKVDIAQKEALRKKFNLPSEQYLIVIAARLEPEKGILPFLKLFRYCEHKEKATVIIMGDGSLREQVEQLIVEYQLNVRLTGYLKQKEILNYYTIADCFALPSLSDANPLSCIEALWAGLPLFVSNHVGNYPETIKDGENGYVFCYRNTKEMIQLMDKLIISSEDWRKNASKVSLDIANKVYEPNRAVSTLVENMLNIGDKRFT